jgi:predicted  nucleic acid-binding Zn-ribbon protein
MNLHKPKTVFEERAELQATVTRLESELSAAREQIARLRDCYRAAGHSGECVEDLDDAAVNEGGELSTW